MSRLMFGSIVAFVADAFVIIPPRVMLYSAFQCNSTIKSF